MPNVSQTQVVLAANLLLNSDPTYISFRSLSIFRFLGPAHRLGAGGAG